MKKLIWIIATLFVTVCFSTAALAASEANTDDELRQIAKIMISGKEIPPDCIKQAKGDPKGMIEIARLDSTQDFVVSSTDNACCMGARRCAQWVYGKNKAGKYQKLLGPFFPDEIVSSQVLTNGKSNIIVKYPGGNTYAPSQQFYRFDGKRYQLIP